MSEDNGNSGGGRSLGGGSSEPLPSSWAQPSSTGRVGRIGDWNNTSSSSSSASRSGSGTRIASLRDLQSSAPPPMPSGGVGGLGGRAESQDSDDDDERPDTENWFTGGERSGLSVQNPNAGRRDALPGGDMVRELISRAARAGPPPSRPSSGPRLFTGGGHTLGSDEVESTYVPDPEADERDEEPTVRRLTFWRNGFTVEDGDLYRYDDPNNEDILAEIHAGRAPPSILNVSPGEPVELRVAQRTHEEYVPPPRSAFSGAGQRLGAPVPEVSSGAGSSSNMPGGFPSSTSTRTATTPAASSGERPSMSTMFEVDQSKPMTSVQIRLADGTRMVCRMNLTHTVLDLRNFINASRPENLARPYTIGTTFPNRILDDNNQTIEAAGLKNSVVVQRWE